MPDKKLSPDAILANKIVNRLTTEQLIPDARKEQVLAKILGGTASEGDWRLWVFTAQVDAEREEDN